MCVGVARKQMRYGPKEDIWFLGRIVFQEGNKNGRKTRNSKGVGILKKSLVLDKNT